MHHADILPTNDNLPSSNVSDATNDIPWHELAAKLQADAERRRAAQEAIPEVIEPVAISLTPAVLDPNPRFLKDYRLTQRQTHESEAPHPEYANWWERDGFRKIQEVFKQPIFEKVAPSEEFVIGQDDRSMRVFNFGEPLSAERQQDLERFADITTQFMGSRAYDFMSDVIIGEFAQGKDEPEQNSDEHEHVYAGFGWAGRGVVVINSAVLPDNAPTDTSVEGSLFLQTLLHEFGGHLVHGNVEHDPEARADLERFAEFAGWDVEGMAEDDHDWTREGADNQPYAPLHANPNAVIVPPGGSPTEYGAVNPKETFGETSKHALIGSKILDMMSDTKDAWLDTFQKRMLKPGETMGDRPIATSLDHVPPAVTRYTGEAIRYPWWENSSTTVK